MSELREPVPGIVLRRLTPAHANAYFDLIDRNREHLTRFGDYEDEKNATLEWVVESLASRADENVRFGIWRAGDLIGRADLISRAAGRFVLGYWLGAEYTGRGYATAACRALIDYGRDALGATEIYAGVTHGNTKSVAVLQRLGFERVAEFDTYTRFCLRIARADDRP